MSRILVVEDNASSRKLIDAMLRSAGHDVRVVANADEAIAIAMAEPLDLVIMDIQLPGTDGLTATRLLRENMGTRHLPILAVTAHAMAGDERRILAAGCDAYVAKPIAYNALLLAVDRLTSRPPTRES